MVNPHLEGVSQYDNGIAQDFDNMTYELSQPVVIYNRVNFLDYEEQESVENDTHGLPQDEQYAEPVSEMAYIQELDTKHEMIQSGQMKVGDIRAVLSSKTIIAEEALLYVNDRQYKILELRYVRGIHTVMYVEAWGKKLPNR